MKVTILWKKQSAKTHIRIIQKGLYLLKIHIIINYLLKQIASSIPCSYFLRILLRYHPKQFTDLVQSLSNFNSITFFKNGKQRKIGKVDSQIQIALQGNLNIETHPEKEGKSKKTHISQYQSTLQSHSNQKTCDIGKRTDI